MSDEEQKPALPRPSILPPAHRTAAPALRASAVPVRPALRFGKAAAPAATPTENGDSEYIAIFREELLNYSGAMLQALQTLEVAPETESAWQTLNVKFHTIKGSASSINLPETARLAHESNELAEQAIADNALKTSDNVALLRKSLQAIFAGNKLPDPFTRSGAPEPFAESLRQLAVWKNQPGDSPLRDALLQEMAGVQETISHRNLPGLTTSVGQLRTFIDSVHATPTETFFLVVGRCLNDAAAYLKSQTLNPSLAWNRKWDFYFSSLRVAMATELPRSASLTSAAAPASALDPDMLQTFTEEAFTLFENLEKSLLGWESGIDPAEHKQAVRRCFHTLKGAANSLDLRAMGLSFHELEDFVDALPPEPTPTHTFQFLLRCADQARAYINELATHPGAVWKYDWKQAAGPGPSATVAQGKDVLPAATRDEKQLLRVEAGKIRRLMNWTNELVAEHSRFSVRIPRTRDTQIRLRECLQRLNQAAESLPASSTLKPQPVSTGSTRGELQAITHQLNLCLTDLQSILNTLHEEDRTFRHVSRQLQSDLSDLNMAPVSQLFRRLQRVFRDACTEEGREADLVTEGGSTQIDRAVLDQIYGPMLHLVRNAVAHGIESPEARVKAGKKRRGLIRLSAVPASNHAVIEVQDDGGGINATAVLKRALERKLVPPTTTRISPAEVIQLLFMPGFSTKEEVSSIAGRGVGLDVVKGEVEALNGSVSARTEAGQGTTWSIRVPLALSASEALLVRAGRQPLALPLAYVEKCLRLQPDLLVTKNNRQGIRLDEGVLPYYPLHTVLALTADTEPTHGVIVNTGTTRAVLGVHELSARREIVSKDPGSLLNSLPHLAGATLDADGSLICILQLPNLLNRLQQAALGQNAPEEADPTPTTDPATPDSLQVRVLLVDDSPSVRKMQEKQLRQIGYAITTAASGSAALERLQESNFDLLITDLEMPEMDGLALLEKIRQQPLLNQIPVILISSHSSPQQMARVHEAGAAAYLVKPFSRDSFLAELAHNPALAKIAALTAAPSN